MNNIKALSKRLLEKQLVLAVAESCTGGLIAKSLTDLAGSSAWFDSGVVSYSNQAKNRLLQVPMALIEAHGAVSEPVVAAMAKGVLMGADANVAISTSGIAGPTGGSVEKPVGTVCFGFVVDGQCQTMTQHFSGDREEVRQASLVFAVETLLGLLS